MGKFEKFLGKTIVVVNKEELKLDVTVQDKQKIMDLRKLKENEYEEAVKVLTEVIAKSYPDDDRKGIEKFVDKNYIELMQELAIEFGWTTRKQLEEDMKKFREEAEKKITETE